MRVLHMYTIMIAVAGWSIMYTISAYIYIHTQRILVQYITFNQNNDFSIWYIIRCDRRQKRRVHSPKPTRCPMLSMSIHNISLLCWLCVVISGRHVRYVGAHRQLFRKCDQSQGFAWSGHGFVCWLLLLLPRLMVLLSDERAQIELRMRTIRAV